jgi:dTDP-glucose 4,6-dehydratase
VLVTGGAGFIGSALCRRLVERPETRVVNVDKLTYAGNLGNLSSLRGDARHEFVRADIGDRDAIGALLRTHRPRAVVNFAAETHVDRSIHGPDAFIATNVVATFGLLESVRTWWSALPQEEARSFRFLHVSTDEVYGSLAPGDPAFSESTPYAPNSPYSASKAASDHLVRAWHHTYGLPVLTTNCSNNYGPRQFPEKLIPLMIANAVAGRPLPVYGDGGNVRDWLYVGDHAAAIRAVLERGRPGATYTVGGNAEMTNLEVVHTLCRVLGARHQGRAFEGQIRFVADRPGHDRRYAIDATRIREELGWTPAETFESGIARTVDWYLANAPWLASVQNAEYRRWVELQYAPA